MVNDRRLWIVGASLLGGALAAQPAFAAPPKEASAPPPARAGATGGPAGTTSTVGANPRSPWLGEELPLPLLVKTNQDLAMKALAERQYLVFNLLAGGKVGWDAGDYATAARKWDELLRLPGLDPETERVVRPFLIEARTRAGAGGVASSDAEAVGGQAGRTGATSASGPLALDGPPADAPGEPGGTAAVARHLSPPSAPYRNGGVGVSGTVSAAGAGGAGGSVIWLRRLDGATPRTRPGRPRIVAQHGKVFVPHVVAITPGTQVLLRNDDKIYHDVFSLSKPNQFDSGLYKMGHSFTQTFDHPGPVQLLCNIHTSMLGYVYVVDSPYFAQATPSGAFTINNVPPGQYELQVWNEASTRNFRQTLEVGPAGVNGLAVTVNGEKHQARFVPDKYGTPRQPNLGY